VCVAYIFKLIVFLLSENCHSKFRCTVNTYNILLQLFIVENDLATELSKYNKIVQYINILNIFCLIHWIY